ncbi:hypothetical protein M378DRAFT_171993 [Amanita muscaria Koide BX008]|uniref:Uncharacterized protein n=1 Tax=Amanita muscaria (strain Koide BX008) TaxID=946122 RepID=A0A0C2WM19_AMAMK|nr:hypothetical protein M378DRAFT_171993 [Amanita muscaria Koide BX008]
MGKDALMNLILLVLLLFRRQNHGFNTIYISTSINISMSHSRASRDDQVLFLVLRFRQMQGHRVTSSLSGGKRLLLLSTQLRGNKPACLIRSCPIPCHPQNQSSTNSDCQDRTWAYMAAPAAYHYSQSRMRLLPIHSSHTLAGTIQPPPEVSSLAPSMSVDTHMQWGMEVDPSRYCRNADFSKGGGSGEQA